MRWYDIVSDYSNRNKIYLFLFVNLTKRHFELPFPYINNDLFKIFRILFNPLKFIPVILFSDASKQTTTTKARSFNL